MGRGWGGRGQSPRFRVAWLCFMPEFGRCSFSLLCVPSPLSNDLCPAAGGDEASGGQEGGGGRRASTPRPSLHLPVPTHHLPVPTGVWGGNPGPPAPGSWVQVGVAATSDPLPQPSWFHTSMNSQVSCSEERDNQPIRGLSPRVVGARVYPNFTRSRGPS